MATTREALKYLASLPKITLNNIKPRLPARRRSTIKRKRGLGDRGQGRHGTLPRIGFEGGQTPFYLRIPREPYYKEHSVKKEYVPVSMLQLQRMIDLGRLDTSRPITLTDLCNTKLIKVDLDKKHYGIHLTDEGADIFKAEICLEIQWIDEIAIAALERCGSLVTTRYYDPRALNAVVDPKRYFLTGKPIPASKTPTTDILEYYTSARSRGYLAKPEDIENDRHEMAQKYGYKLPQLSPNVKAMYNEPKSPLQIFYGLQAGWIVNLMDKEIVKPTDQRLDKLYNMDSMF